MGFWVLRRGVPRALLALFEPFFFWPGDFPRLFAPSDEPVDGVALAAELVAVVVEGETWRESKKGNTIHSNYEGYMVFVWKASYILYQSQCIDEFRVSSIK